MFIGFQSDMYNTSEEDGSVTACISVQEADVLEDEGIAVTLQITTVNGSALGMSHVTICIII